MFVLELYYLENTCGRHCNDSLNKHETTYIYVQKEFKYLISYLLMVSPHRMNRNT